MPLLRFLPEASNIDFIGARYYAFAVDGLLLLITILSITFHGFNLGLDFTGGVEMQVKSARVIDIAEIRREVSGLGFSDPGIQYMTGSTLCDKPANSCVLIRVQPKANQDGNAAKVQIQNKLGSAYSDRKSVV
jgi:preprotein translocase subunit SecF